MLNSSNSIHSACIVFREAQTNFSTVVDMQFDRQTERQEDIQKEKRKNERQKYRATKTNI